MSVLRLAVKQNLLERKHWVGTNTWKPRTITHVHPWFIYSPGKCRQETPGCILAQMYYERTLKIIVREQQVRVIYTKQKKKQVPNFAWVITPGNVGLIRAEITRRYRFSDLFCSALTHATYFGAARGSIELNSSAMWKALMTFPTADNVGLKGACVTTVMISSRRLF